MDRPKLKIKWGINKAKGFTREKTPLLTTRKDYYKS